MARVAAGMPGNEFCGRLALPLPSYPQVVGGLADIASPAFKAFKRWRQAPGTTLTSRALLAEWRALGEEKRLAFERGEVPDSGETRPAQGSAKPVPPKSSAATFLQEQQRKQLQPRVLSPERPQQQRASKKRKEAVPVVQIPLPSFPRWTGPSGPAAGAFASCDQRRRELEEKVRARDSTVSVASSTRLDFADVQAQVTAPTLSFDWHAAPDKDIDDVDVEEAIGEDLGPELEVDLPAATGGNKTDLRTLLRDQAERKSSAKRFSALIAAKAAG